MLEAAGAICAGAAVSVAVIAFALPTPIVETGAVGHIRGPLARLWVRESELAAASALTWLNGRRLLGVEVAAAIMAGLTASAFTELPVLALPAAAGAVAVVRSLVGARTRARRTERQDAVLEAVRMLRQVLEVGAGSVHHAINVLAERGPLPLRADLQQITRTTLGRRQAWALARDRIGEPLFDMLAAAVLIQGPGGGELAPLFAELETTVTDAQEVEREAEALQVQARSASAIIVCLPIAFLLILSTFRSPYLDAFHSLPGQVFLVLMLAVMAASYAWMRRILRLEGLERVRLVDA